MKKILLGGFYFVGGAVMFSVGILGFAEVNVQAYYNAAATVYWNGSDDCRRCFGDLGLER